MAHRIGIDGRSGAGKTHLAARMAATFAATSTVQVLSLEDLYPGWHGLSAGITAVARVLGRVQQTGSATYRCWDWHAGEWGERRRFGPAEILIVEGVGAGSAAIRPYLDVALFLALAEHPRRQRVLARDGRRDEQWWQTWARQEEQYLTAEDPQRNADVVLRTG